MRFPVLTAAVPFRNQPTLMKTLLAYLALARPLNGLIAFISAWLGGIFASQGDIETLLNLPLLLVSVAAFLLLSAGNAINDYCDYDIDRINRPTRPLPSGQIPRSHAPVFAGVLTAIGIGLGVLISREAVIIAIVVSAALAGYAFWLKGTPFLGNLVVSGLTGITFISGGVAMESIQGTLTPAIFAFLFITAREIVKDMEDTEGDRENNVRTLATLSPGTARWTALGFMAAVILFSPCPYLLGWYSWHYLLIVAVGVDLVLIALGVRLWRDPSRASCAVVQRWMKWDIFIGLGAIYLGTFL